ncbi:hypothetical protein IC617_07830 [Neiella sp. HB171785]|uniref:Uncharacterized protein n=1 Tax=Neiella litorisoli TaxID=2771431 RepID=A0A8J6QQF4_9GAMM|nr:hypothetical protein [Neiella litorisoli]MBD1389331.1 hypothetical protein [Neiella litorisoli]
MSNLIPLWLASARRLLWKQSKQSRKAGETLSQQASAVGSGSRAAMDGFTASC